MHEMYSQPPMLAKFSLLVFFLLLNDFFTDGTMAQTPPFSVKVGVVVDMDSDVGEMGLNCIKMALSDFYDRRAYYQTRLVLNSKDSKGDVVGAAAAALDLLKNVEVQAIIGPLTSTQANFMIHIGDKAHVPIITFSATSPSLLSIRSPYFVRATLSDSSQVEAIGAIVQAFGWREVVPIYVDNEFGEGIMPSLADTLEQAYVRIPYKSAIPSSATEDRLALELYKLMTMQTRVFIVHLTKKLGSRLFTKAKLLGMMSDDYVWITTDGMAYELNSLDPSVIEAMQGVIGVLPHFPKTTDSVSFSNRYKKEIQQNNRTVHHVDLNIFGLWAYDSAVALALAVEKAKVRNDAFLKANISRPSTDLEDFGVSSMGTELIQALSSTTFRGLAGDFYLADGQLRSPPYQIVNMIGLGAQVVGYWTKESGIVRELNTTKPTSKYSTSKSNIGSITWPGNKKSPAKGWVIPTSGKKLRIGVPVKNGFYEFMHVTWDSNNSTEVTGYSKDVFDMVIEALPYGLEYEYIPFATSDHKKAGSYDDLVYQVHQGTFDAAVGDISIVANRSQYVDFTLPYTESGVSMVVAIKDGKSKKAWVFLKPLTWELWLTSFCSFVFMGFIIWILEHRTNEDFRGPPWYQFGMIFWFAFSTIVFAHKERVISNLSKFLLIIWFLVVLILTQSYTASLSSMLTVEQLRPTITDVNELIRNKENVGYQNGSFVLELLKGMNINASRLFPYNSRDELDELFTNGTIAAAFVEIPYIKLFLDKYCSKYTTIGPTYKTDGFGFVFPRGSPLVPDISRAILNVTEGEKIMEIEKKWFRNAKCQDSSDLSHPNSLGLESFWGLFTIVGTAGVLALIIYLIRFLYENWHDVHQCDAEATLGSKALELFRRFNNKDLSCHTFKNTGRRDNSCGCDCSRRVNESSNQNFQFYVSPSTLSYNSPDNNDPPTPSPVSPSSEEHEARTVSQE